MSGAEAAGLVLGAIPLVVSALEHYVEGVDTITRWWRYKAELTSLANILYAENARFLLTCERLLRDIVSAHDLELLMADPGGPQWADVELENKLRQRLQFSYAAYSQAVEDMAGAVKEFQTKLKLDLNWQVSDFVAFEGIPYCLDLFGPRMSSIGKNWQYTISFGGILQNTDTSLAPKEFRQFLQRRIQSYQIQPIKATYPRNCR